MKKVFLPGFIILFMTAFFMASPVSGEETEGSDKCNYFLIFQLTEYNAKLSDAVDYFFEKILNPGDQLLILSPLKPYNYSQKTLQTQPKEKLIEMTKKILKRDIASNAAYHQQILNAMTQIVISIAEELGTSPTGSSASGGSRLESQTKAYLVNYRQLLENLHNLRKLNEDLFLKLAELFKKTTGKNRLYIFYQKELRIIPNRETMDVLLENRDLKFDANEVFIQDSTKEFINVERVSHVLKESLVTLSFFYLNKQEKRRRDLEYKEFSTDIYNVFSKLARATGGIVISTSKPEAALKKAAEAEAKK
jgi:hypothetical protein